MKRLTGIAALVAALACGDSRPLVPCSSDAECKNGRECVDGYCESDGGSGSPSDASTSSDLEGKIAFVTDRDGNNEIYVMNVKTGTQKNITNHPASDRRPRWSPDGLRIAFLSQRENDPATQLYIIDGEGRGIKKLVSTPNSVISVAWSPTGEEIAFTISYVPNHTDEKVYLVSSSGDGSIPREIVAASNDPEGYLDNFLNLSWSSDGATLVYEDQSIDESTIFTMSAAGNNIQNLTDKFTSMYGANPRWSPDGSSLVFAKDSLLQLLDYRTMPFSYQKIPVLGTRSEDYPCWSPDGKHIAFSGITEDDNDNLKKMGIVSLEGGTFYRLGQNPSGNERDCDWTR